MKLTKPQRELLRVLRLGPHRVDGAQFRVAQSLARKGLALTGVGGSGIAYKGRWWWEARLTDAGRVELERDDASA